MIVKLSKSEQKTLKAVDPGKGARWWMTAREIAAAVFGKKPENLNQDNIRTVRNAFRKLVRESLMEMSGADRGKYRISERGRKVVAAGATEFDSKFERGTATDAAKAQAEARMKSKPRKKAATKKAAKKAKAKKSPKKPPRKPTKAKAAVKAKAKKQSKPAKKTKIAVEDKTSKETKGGNSNGQRRGTPTFKRRKVKSSYTDQTASN